jgi:hypothetical protein
MTELNHNNLLIKLSDFLNPQLEELVLTFSDPIALEKYYVEIPDTNYIDLTINDLGSLVARSSNVYGRAARFAGIARAQYKLLEAQYKRIYKANRIGKNEAEREAAAAAAADMELAARISSESSRKLMDKVQIMQIASSREEKGFLLERDFSTF